MGIIIIWSSKPKSQPTYIQSHRGSWRVASSSCLLVLPSQQVHYSWILRQLQLQGIPPGWAALSHCPWSPPVLTSPHPVWSGWGSPRSLFLKEKGMIIFPKFYAQNPKTYVCIFGNWLQRRHLQDCRDSVHWAKPQLQAGFVACHGPCSIVDRLSEKLKHYERSFSRSQITYFTTLGVVPWRMQETDADSSILKLQGNFINHYQSIKINRPDRCLGGRSAVWRSLLAVDPGRTLGNWFPEK